MNKQKTVPFDPGITKYYPIMDINLLNQIEGISKLKATNQRKFQFQILEKQLASPLETITAIYYGCVIYGSTLAFKYKETPMQITDNPILIMPDDKLKSIDNTFEPKFILEVYQKLNKNILFNMKRKGNLLPEPEKYINPYIKFVELNNHFKDLKSTDQIRIPEETQHFSSYSEEKLNQIEELLFELGKNGNIKEILNIS